MTLTMATARAYAKGTAFPFLRPSVLRLYNMRFCPFAQRTRLVLEHKGIQYETINVNLRYKPDWFLERNPVGLVPVLEKDGKVVYESAVCNDYLDDLYPQKRLNPTDLYERARDRQLSETFGRFIDQFYALARSDGEINQVGKAVHKMKKELNRYEKELGTRGTFFGGDKVCMVDFMIWPWFERYPLLGRRFPEADLTSDRYPRLHNWMEQMYKLPAVKATLFDMESHAAFIQSLYFLKNPNYDYGLENEAISSKL